MEIFLSYEPWGYKNVSAVIDSITAEYCYDERTNCGILYPHITCFVGKHKITLTGPCVWETLVIKPRELHTE